MPRLAMSNEGMLSCYQRYSLNTSALFPSASGQLAMLILRAKLLVLVHIRDPIRVNRNHSKVPFAQFAVHRWSYTFFPVACAT